MQHGRAAVRALANNIPTAWPGQVSQQNIHLPFRLARTWRKARPHDHDEAFIQSHSVAVQSVQMMLVFEVTQHEAGCTTNQGHAV